MTTKYIIEIGKKRKEGRREKEGKGDRGTVSGKEEGRERMGKTEREESKDEKEKLYLYI